MYKENAIDEKRFSLLMDSLKSENQKYKRLISSKEYKIGRYITEFLKAFQSFRTMKGYLGIIAGQIRWKKLCKQYPICRVDDGLNIRPNYFSSERFIVYTSIFGSYDFPQEPLFRPDNCEFYIITDQEISNDSVWKKYDTEKLNGYFEGLSDAEKNRFCKMLPHILFPNTKKSIYVDGNIKVITDLTEFINLEMKHGMIFHKHKARNCVYDEIEACKILRKSNAAALSAYESYLRGQKFPKGYGMVECNVIVRDQSNDLMKKIMWEWWEQFRRNDVKRDQLSFPYLLWKHDIRVDEVTALGNNVAENPALRVVAHKGKK